MVHGVRLLGAATVGLGGGYAWSKLNDKPVQYPTALAEKSAAQLTEEYYEVKEQQEDLVTRSRRLQTLSAQLPQPPTREEMVAKLDKTEFDVVIIGGGATGAGSALDARTRGLEVALFEDDDFASGTSSRSTKLIHGGVRYLEKAVFHLDYGQLHLVFEALHERANLLRNAPHLTQPLPIMTPCYKWWEIPYYWAGLKMYDVVAGTQKLYWSRFISKSESTRQFPMLTRENNRGETLKGAVVYYDGQMDDARVNVALALTAASRGAVVLNHTKVTKLIKNEETGVIEGVAITDNLTGKSREVKCKTLINATGPFTDEVRQMDNEDAEKIVAPSSGVHVTLPDYYSPDAMGLIVPKTKDGRVVFMLPWLGSTIAGTTDSSVEITRNPQPTEDEISFILEAITDYVQVQVRRKDVRAAWSGIRPLAKDPNVKDTASVSRDHMVDAKDTGIVTIAGGKWTTYRKMAEDAVDAAVKVGHLTNASKCVTAVVPLIGADHWDPALFTHLTQQFVTLKGAKSKWSRKHGVLGSAVAKHLANSYGDRAPLLAKLAEEGYGRKLAHGHPVIEAEVVYCARHEHACTAVDFLARRSRLAFLDADAANAALPRVVHLMAKELGWDRSRKADELTRAKAFLETMSNGRHVMN